MQNHFVWQRFPFVRLVLAFIAGIVAHRFLQPSLTVSSVILGIGFSIFLVLWILQRYKYKSEFKSLLGFVSLLLLFSFGVFLPESKDDRNQSNHLVYFNQAKIDAFKGAISEHVVPKEHSIKTTIEVQSVRIDSIWKPASGKVLVYFQQSKFAHFLRPGDMIVASGRINEVSAPTNPEMFDFKAYLANKNIYHQTYITSDHWVKNGHSDSFVQIILSWAHSSRSFLETKLKSGLKRKREEGIALALVLGVKDDLDNDIRDVYSEVGAMHILAVSGLHVGLIYAILHWLIGGLKLHRKTRGRVLQAILLVLAIWFYAFVTGLSPSVVRAATMFSFIIVGDAFKRTANIYNTLAASAFLLLCVHPGYLYEVGFQLSYLAVLGIVYIQPKIYEVIDIKYRWLDRIWMITTVSIAAQIATSPVSIYYFHQFPNYFILSNLFAIPAATGILTLGIIKMAVSWISFLDGIVGWMLEKLIWLTNEIMLFIAHLPGAVTRQIDLTLLQTWFLYLAIFLMLLFLYYKKLFWLIGVNLLVMTVLGIWMVRHFQENAAKEIITYNVRGKTAIGLREGHTLKFIYSDQLYQDVKTMQFNILGHWKKRHINQISAVALEDARLPSLRKQIAIESFLENHLLLWNGLKIFIIDHPLKMENTEVLPVFDVLILRHNAYLDNDLIPQLRFKKLIIDSSCNPWYIKHHKAWLNNENSYVVGEQGAVILDCTQFGM